MLTYLFANEYKKSKFVDQMIHKYFMCVFLKKQAKVVYHDEVESREELFGEDGEDQRTRLLDNTERLERSSRNLETGYRMAVEAGSWSRIITKILECGL